MDEMHSMTSPSRDSSFQLEQMTIWRVAAIICHPNHLDRHGNECWQAKLASWTSNPRHTAVAR
jgi:hypothetical protein